MKVAMGAVKTLALNGWSCSKMLASILGMLAALAFAWSAIGHCALIVATAVIDRRMMMAYLTWSLGTAAGMIFNAATVLCILFLIWTEVCLVLEG